MRVAPVVLSCLLIVLSAASLWAETLYVVDQLIVTVRRGPGTQYKILDSLKSGSAVEVLEESGDYLKVRTAKGIEGYTLRQYYNSEIPKAIQIARLEKVKANLSRKIAQLEESQVKSSQAMKAKDADLQAEQNRLNEEMTKQQALLDEKTAIEKKYAQLQRDAGQVVQITEERNRLKQKNQALTERLGTLQEENAELIRSGMIHWFLAGGGVFFVGWLAGKVSRKKRSTF